MTGIYNFEDNNLDCFSLHEKKATTFYHGLNRADEWYETPKNLRKPDHKRKKKYPSPTEFWDSETPQTFRLLAGDEADWRKFKRWLLRTLRDIEAQPGYDYDTAALEACKSEIDLCLGDFDEKGVVNTEMAIHKYDQSIFMTKEEIDALPDELKPKRIVPPTMLDLDSVERVHIKKEDMKVQEIQAEQDKLSQFV